MPTSQTSKPGHAIRDPQYRAHRLAMRCLCLHAMSVVYGRCHMEIGPVSDIPLLVYLLDRTPSAPERDCLLLLLDKLMLNKVCEFFNPALSVVQRRCFC